MKEFWIKKKNGSSLRLPVAPAEFNLSESVNIENENINNLGEVGLYGGNNLQKIELASFFPKKYHPYCQYKNIKKPYDCVNFINQSKEKGEPVRLLITGSNINKEFLIESFEYGEKDGTGDVYFTINFVEYKIIKIPKVKKSSSSSSPSKKPSRPSKKPSKNKKYTVKKGDCLWNIAKKFYGKGSLYKKIYNANKSKIKNPNRIYPGQVLIIP